MTTLQEFLNKKKQETKKSRKNNYTFGNAFEIKKLAIARATVAYHGGKSEIVNSARDAVKKVMSNSETFSRRLTGKKNR